MNTRLPCLLAVFVTVMITLPVRAQPPLAQAGVPPNAIRLEVFVRNDSETSKRASQFALDLQDKTRGLEVVIHDVLSDKEQLSRLWKLTKQAGREKPVVPAFYCCNRILYGFTGAEETGPSIQELYTVDVYTRSTCSRCIAAKAFFRKLETRWPALRFRIYEITRDPIARRRYEELCNSKGQLPGLPTIHFAGQVIIGYQGDQITGAQFEKLLNDVSKPAPPAPEVSPNKEDTSAIQRHGNTSSATVLVAYRTQQQNLPLQNDGLDDSTTAFDDVPLPEEATAFDMDSAELSREPSQVAPATDVIDVPVFGKLRVSRLGLPLFTFLVGLVDGFNPCAMWILVFLLSVLVNIKDRRKILLIAGTFVVVSGIAYFAFMAAWLNLFLLIGIARPAQVTLGLFALVIGVVNVKDFFAFKKGVSFSIPESSKPGIYKRVREIVAAKYLTTALVGVVVLAVVVNMVELLCTAGLPALYTQVLTMHELPAWKNYGYLGLYILAYMLDDTILLTIVVVTLSHRKLQEREGRWLKLTSGLVILAIGLVMIFRPEWLQLGQ